MKKTITLTLFLVFSFALLSQSNSDWPPQEEQIGSTYYDLQTTRSMQDRIFHYSDGTIGAVFNMKVTSLQEENKVGYNFYDGNSWGTFPQSSITSGEAINPSYTDFGENGEICASEGESGIYISYRPEKGTGDWQEIIFSGPTGDGKLFSPQIVTSGVDSHIINLFVLWKDTSLVNLGQENIGKVLYSRSSDIGITWDPYQFEFELNIGSFGFSELSLIPADPKDDVLAFVVGDYFTNLLLVKSTDGGDTWQETMIWEHPFPYMQFGVTVTDTFWANSGSMDIALDENLRANVVFALCRIKSDETGWYYDPMADGIVYWNEDMDAFSNNINALNPTGHPDSELIEDYNLIGWTQDINENGVIDFVSSSSNPPFYPSLGLSTTPSITTDDFERITVVWSSLTETFDNGINNYRHLWVRLSPNNGELWGSFADLTSDLIHIFDECVFPNSATLVDDYLHLIYQVDQSPGWSGNNYPPNENQMNYMKVSLYGYPPPYIQANFTSDFTTIHEGDTVHFINLSEINPPGIISSYWTFEGGDPGSSYTTNPYVIYYNEGSYDVSLIVEGSQMTDFEIKEDYITVLPQTGFRDFNCHDFISIAPNPAFDDVFVQVNKREIGAIQIIDYLGKVVFKSASILTNEVKLDLSYLQRGVYFIIISGEEFIHTQKIILK